MEKPSIDREKKIRNSFLLFLAAFVWGISFVSQKDGGDKSGPYTFNCIRSILGGICLLPVIRLLDHWAAKKQPEGAVKKKNGKELMLGGAVCGIILFVASTLQQLGMYYGTQAGKAGFLTACYILLVPILGIFLKRKCPVNVWIGVFLALVGLFFLCMTGPLGFQKSDLLVIACALCFSVHILTVDHFSPIVDGVRLACMQFFVCGICGILPMILLDIRPDGFSSWLHALASVSVWISIGYAGLFSCGVGYTLQIVGQEGLNPTIAALLMSLESVFSVMAGALLLKERMTGREILGCVILFAAIILAQLPPLFGSGKNR